MTTRLGSPAILAHVAGSLHAQQPDPLPDGEGPRLFAYLG